MKQWFGKPILQLFLRKMRIGLTLWCWNESDGRVRVWTVTSHYFPIYRSMHFSIYETT
jgi:hypothetical protein